MSPRTTSCEDTHFCLHTLCGSQHPGVTRLLPYPSLYGFVPLVPTFEYKSWHVTPRINTLNLDIFSVYLLRMLSQTEELPYLKFSPWGRRRNISWDIYSDGQNRLICGFRPHLFGPWFFRLTKPSEWVPVALYYSIRYVHVDISMMNIEHWIAL